MFFFLLLPLAAQDFDKGVIAFEAGDYVTALKEWRPFADQGVSSGQYNLAIMYTNGWGIGQDQTEAIRWYKLAAKHTTVPWINCVIIVHRIFLLTPYRLCCLIFVQTTQSLQISPTIKKRVR
tara:strand:+ start:211 stop:576 length:366 start_codon:yes stop_codon:yes gene_type:complete